MDPLPFPLEKIPHHYQCDCYMLVSGPKRSDPSTSRSCTGLVHNRLSQGLQHLSLVVVEVSVDVVDRAVLHHPQLALGLRDEPGIVAHNDHSCRNKKIKMTTVTLLLLLTMFVSIYSLRDGH